MKKKLLSLGMAAAMAASLAACGGQSAAGTTGAADSKASDESTAVESNADAKETTVAAGEGGTIKIGGIEPLTGGAAVYGIAVKNGGELAVKEINEAGGINGMTIEYKFEDDEHDAEKAVNAYNTLKDWGCSS